MLLLRFYKLRVVLPILLHDVDWNFQLYSSNVSCP